MTLSDIAEKLGFAVIGSVIPREIGSVATEWFGDPRLGLSIGTKYKILGPAGDDDLKRYREVIPAALLDDGPRWPHFYRVSIELEAKP